MRGRGFVKESTHSSTLKLLVTEGGGGRHCRTGELKSRGAVRIQKSCGLG